VSRRPLLARGLSRVWTFAWFGGALLLTLRGSPGDVAHALDHALLPGYDAFGRALLPLTLRASALSSAFAFGAVVVSMLLASVLGSALALSRGAVHEYGLRALELLLAFPPLLFALAWAAVSGPGWDTLLISLALASIPPLTRLVYARARELLLEDYVLAARSLGATDARIVTRHLMPGVLALCRVKTPNLFAGALMAEATLSFLGVGAPIGRDTWGSLLAQGKDYLLEAPHIALAAGVPLFLTILSLQIGSERLAPATSRGL
jgi:ABC-type dipeptide/oligopeptide/nickel transport system permease subunit